MTTRRRREWRNESGILSVGVSSQVAAQVGTSVFEKGATLVRSIFEFTVTPVTTNTDGILWIALWVGHGGGPADISADGNDTYVYWTRIVHNLSTAEGTGATERFQYRRGDIRSQRRSRQDDDNVELIGRSSGASAHNLYYVIRTLYLLP